MPSPKMKRLNKLHKIKKAAERKPGVFSNVAKRVGLLVEELVEKATTVSETVVEKATTVSETVVEKVVPVWKKTKKVKKTLKTDD